MGEGIIPRLETVRTLSFFDDNTTYYCSCRVFSEAAEIVLRHGKTNTPDKDILNAVFWQGTPGDNKISIQNSYVLCSYLKYGESYRLAELVGGENKSYRERLCLLFKLATKAAAELETAARHKYYVGWEEKHWNTYSSALREAIDVAFI